MKRILFVSVLGVFVLGLTVAMAAAENFSGTWALDYSKSQGLPENAPKDMSWSVTQTATELIIERPGMGGGRGGAGGAAAPAPYKAIYKLDGSETTEATPGPRPGKVTRKAKWLAGGKTLELNDVRKQTNAEGNDVTLTTTEHWVLRDGGKTLKVHRKQESPQGARETTFILNKK